MLSVFLGAINVIKLHLLQAVRLIFVAMLPDLWYSTAALLAFVSIKIISALKDVVASKKNGPAGKIQE